MDLLPAGWESLGAKGLVAIFVVMVLLGWLIPKRQLDRELAAKSAALHEANETIAVQRETIERLTNATQSLAVSANTSAMALRSISKSAEPKGGDEE